MVSSAVFFDLAARPLTVAPMPPLEGALAEAVCQMPVQQTVVTLPSSVETAAQQLTNIVMVLCSPESGWPVDLPQTPENLAAYVSEEVDELLEALSQAEPSSLSLAPTVAPTCLLADWLPSLLWQIAGSGYEIMRLLEGVQARLYREPDTWEMGVVRLVPLLTLQTHGAARQLDLVTQTQLQSNWLENSAVVQLAEGDLVGGLCSVDLWIATITQQVRQQNLTLAKLLDADWPVEALIPGEEWCSGSLSLQFHLVMEADFEPVAATWSMDQVSWNTDFFQEVEQTVEEIVPLPLNAFTLDASASEIEARSSQFTLDDFAEMVEVSSPTFTLDDFAGTVEVAGMVEAVAQPLAVAQKVPSEQPYVNTSALVLQPRFSDTAEDDLLAAWVTIVDEAWIQTFLQINAGELFCQKLRNTLAQDCVQTSEMLVEAAYQAVAAVLGTDGLFKHTFVHQPLLLADLWPRWRWYLTRTSQTLMEMMSGLSVQWLIPGAAWQQGTLSLKTFAILELDEQTWYLDLVNGQALPNRPATIPQEALVYPLTSDLGKQPIDIAQTTELIAAQLAHPTRSLATWLEGVAIDLHRLEATQANQTGRLQIAWQLSLQPEH